ncbi:MAG: putative membrane protein [Chlamydiales bacterium]|jgi:uncharacterized membrane protein
MRGMGPTPADATGSVDPDGVNYESSPLARAEYISAVVHLYRGELYRSNSWRQRLDMTTNWAVFTTAGLLSFAFSSPTHSHWILLMGLALIAIFHGFEARRYRIWHVWRSRVRMIEENFYGPILRRDPQSPDRHWGALVAEDLFRPRFKITRLPALRARLVRNYWAIYLVLLLAWIVKVFVVSGSSGTWIDHLRDNSVVLPWWLPLVYVGAFLGSVLILLCVTPRSPGSEADYWTLEEGAEHAGALSEA